MNKKLFFYIIFVSLFLQFIGSLVYSVFLKGSNAANIAYVVVKVVLLLLPLVLLLIGFRLPEIKSKRKVKLSIILGISSGIAISILLFIIYFVNSFFFAHLKQVLLEKTINFGVVNFFILFIFVFSILNSLLEEYFWRWFAFRGLMIKFTPVVAAIVSSVLFASHHFILLSQLFPWFITILFGVFVFIGGLIWCWIYQKTNSFWGMFISHMLVDAAILVVGYLIMF